MHDAGLTSFNTHIKSFKKILFFVFYYCDWYYYYYCFLLLVVVTFFFFLFFFRLVVAAMGICSPTRIIIYIMYFITIHFQHKISIFFSLFVHEKNQNKMRDANTKTCISFLVFFIFLGGFTIEYTCNGDNFKQWQYANYYNFFSLCLFACLLLLGWFSLLFICSQISEKRDEES